MVVPSNIKIKKIIILAKNKKTIPDITSTYLIIYETQSSVATPKYDKMYVYSEANGEDVSKVKFSMITMKAAYIGMTRSIMSSNHPLNINIMG